VAPEQLSVGLVGCGRIAQAAHLPALTKADHVRLQAVCDASPTLSEAIGHRYEVTAYPSIDALLASDVDAVVIAVPDRLHLSTSRQALLAGKHVLVEKPVAATVSEARQLATMVNESGRQLQVASMKRYDPGVQFAATMLAEGRIGKILSVSAWYRVMSALRAPTEATYFPRIVVDPEVRRRELALKQANRTDHLLRTHGVHTFDLLRHLVGDVDVLGAYLAQEGSDYSWHGTGRLRQGGGLASFEITASVHAEWTEGFDIYGDRGHLRVRVPFPFTRQASQVSLFEEGTGRAISPVFGDTDPYERQLEAFAHAILTGTAVRPNVEDGTAALEIIEAIHAAVARANNATAQTTATTDTCQSGDKK
jgi:predicted dehydrogenase